jgi:hypothetical protein
MVSEDELKKKHDLPDDWTVETKEAPPEHTESNVSSKLLWTLAIIIFIAAISVFMMLNSPEPIKIQTAEIQGVLVTAPGDPYEWLAAVTSKSDLVGKHLNIEKTDASSSVLMEIGEVLRGRSSLASGGSGYDVIVGLSDRTGITIEKDKIYIEGTTEDELWEAAWIFSAVASTASIESDIPLSEIDELFKGVDNVAVIIDEENGCPDWPRISSALGNINGAVGFQQAGSDYIFSQYLMHGNCELQFRLPEENVTLSGQTSVNQTPTDQTPTDQTPTDQTLSNQTQGSQTEQISMSNKATVDSNLCPVSGDKSVVIILEHRDENKIAIKGNEIRVQYTDCASMVRLSLIVRDMIAPRLLFGLSTVSFPTYV